MRPVDVPGPDFASARRKGARIGPWPRLALLALALPAALPAFAQDSEAAPAAEAGGNKFLFVPYPITEPAIGSGVLAGPVWMRDGPSVGSGPSKPQAFGLGALWTDGGSRGLVVFDHRAWMDGRWRTTAVLGRADIRLSYPGLSPQDDRDLGFTLSVDGIFLQAQRALGKGPNSLALKLFSASTKVEFQTSLPPELAGERSQADVAGMGITWAYDTRDDVFTPSKGQSLSLGLTVHPSFMGSSFEQQSVNLDWASYHKGFGKGVLGLRARAEASHGDPPFYLRPYVALRGVAAMRYAGEQVSSLELEYRQPMGKRWDLLLFTGAGQARSSRDGAEGRKSVQTQGLGFRFKAMKLFGLTFGLDFAHGPDGTVSYIQIGNAWAR